MVKFVKILPLSAKIGSVTIKYPFDKPLVTDSFRGAIEINTEKCVGCGACTRICPPKALTLISEGETQILRYFVGRCIFCGMCADTCPEKAIKITKEFELASDQITELYTDIEHEVCLCRKCGSLFVSRKLLNKIKTLTEIIPDNIMELCPRCRRIETISKFVNPGENVHGV